MHGGLGLHGKAGDNGRPDVKLAGCAHHHRTTAAAIGRAAGLAHQIDIWNAIRICFRESDVHVDRRPDYEHHIQGCCFDGRNAFGMHDGITRALTHAIGHGGVTEEDAGEIDDAKHGDQQEGYHQGEL